MAVDVGLTLDDAIEAIWTEVAQRRASSVDEAVRSLWPLPLSDDATQSALRSGLISIAHDRQKERRAGKRQPIAFGRPHGRHWAPYMTTLSTPFEDADGREKPLLDFAAADYGAYRARCITIGTAWLKRAKAAEHVIKMLAKHGVSYTKDLPADVLEDVAARLDEAFQ